MTTILSANFAHSDDIVGRQTQQSIDVNWVMVVEPDSPLLKGQHGVWKMLPAPIRAPGRPRLESRYPKMMPWDYVEDDTVIWIDANMQVTHPGFAEWVLSHEGPLVCFSHPQRQCCYEEVRAASWLPKHLPQPMHVQAAHYRAEGFPPDAGLYACGTMLSRITPEREVLGHAWMYEQTTWTDHDQVSLPIVSHRLDIPIGVFKEDGHISNQLNNPYIRIVANHRA